MTGKRVHLLGSVPIDTAPGLEVGPLTAPMVLKREGPIRYVDYLPTEKLRAAQHDPSVAVADIVEVDIVWGERPLRELAGGPVAYVLASHVVEHVPDLIGWLLELHDALLPGGTLGLAIPDRRFTFDLWRRESSLAEMVEAHLLGFRRPSVRQVFDVASLAAPVDAGEAWQADLRAGAPPSGKLAEAFALARSLAADPRHIDVHCWVFTPASFLDTAEGLLGLGLFPFAIALFRPAEPGELEFLVRLTAGAGAAQAGASIAAARRTLAAAAPAPGEPTPGEPAALAQENAALRQSLRLLRASTSWRITAPLRALGVSGGGAADAGQRGRDRVSRLPGSRPRTRSPRR